VDAINLADAKAHLSELVDRVEAGTFAFNFEDRRLGESLHAPVHIAADPCA